jgi:hypothetical protein
MSCLWLVVESARAGSFSAVSDDDLQEAGASGSAWADVDGDGDWDLVLPGTAGLRILVATGDPEDPFDDVTGAAIAGSGGPVLSVVAADLDGDGWVDLVSARPDEIAAWRNDGAGGFGDPVLSLKPPGKKHFSTVVAADLFEDAARDLDLVVPIDDASSIWLNDSAPGTIAFTESAFDGSTSPTDQAALFDFDRDGWADLFVRAGGGTVAWLGSAGTSGNELLPAVPALALTSDVRADHQGSVLGCDIDRDGAFELLWTEDAAFGTAFWEAGWIEGPTLPHDKYTTAAACGDLDGDGLPDVYAADDDADRVFLQQAGGTFVPDEPDSGEDRRGVGATLVDFDQDGDLDALVVNADGDSVLYQNDLGAIASAAHLELRIEQVLGDCASGRILRDDFGALGSVTDPSGAEQVEALVAGGGRSGSWPVLHFGVADPAATQVVTVDPSDPLVVPYALEVAPDTLGSPLHLLAVAEDDRDGDGILDADEPGDSDGDGYDDALDRDADGDGWSDAVEAGDADPCTAPVDTDADGTPDFLDLDSDDDGLSDADEITYGTDPTDPDTDGGGATDGAEAGCTNPNDAADDASDADGDGLLPPIDPANCDEDADDDGLTDAEEVAGDPEFGGTDPGRADSDGDGLLDGLELGLSSPHSADTVAAGFAPDSDASTRTDPSNADTDGDGLLDGEEDYDHDGRHDVATWEPDPNVVDTDGGGIDDYEEVQRATNPDDPRDDYVAGDPLGGRGAAGGAGEVGCACGSTGPGVVSWGWALILAVRARRRAGA